VRSPLPRRSGERESAIFQAAGAIVGSSRPAPPRPGELQEVTLRSSPGSGPATKYRQDWAGGETSSAGTEEGTQP
jgi:hypothetical protein